MSYLNWVNPKRVIDIESAISHVERNILPLLPADHDAIIIELGCGTGRYVSALHTMGYKNTKGCDSDSDSVRFGAESLGLGSSIICQDLFSYISASNDGSHDVILLIDVIEHLTQEVTLNLLRNLRRKLKAGGIIVIQTPNAFSPFQPTYWGDCTHRTLYSKSSLQQMHALSGYPRVSFKEVPIRIHGPKSFIRWLIWNILLHPAILTFHILAYGNDHGRIYSANLISITRNEL